MSCEKCTELVVCRQQIVMPTHFPSGGPLAIGEAPGADEDRIGEGFVGAAGKRLDTLLASNGLTRHRNYGVANLIRCRPPGNRKPTRGELANCLPLLADFLMETKPSVLLLVGNSATEVFLGRDALSNHITRSRASTVLLARHAHPALQDAVRSLHRESGVIHAVPMPHTSGLAWNRKAPDGRQWRDVGVEQVSLAVSLLPK